MDPREAVIPDLLSREVDTIEGYSRLLVKRELGETKGSCKMQRGSCHKHPRETNGELEIPQQATSSPAAIMIHDLPKVDQSCRHTVSFEPSIWRAVLAIGSYSGHSSVHSENIYNHAHMRKDTNYFVASNGKLGGWEHCYTASVSPGYSRPLGVVPGSFVLRFLPSFCHRPRLPIQCIHIPEHHPVVHWLVSQSGVYLTLCFHGN